MEISAQRKDGRILLDRLPEVGLNRQTEPGDFAVRHTA